MSQSDSLARQLFEGLGKAVETAQALAPGLKNIGPQIGNELKQLADHGKHELAAALFNGNAFVMYPRQTNKEDQPTQEQEHGNQDMQHDAMSQALERGGRSM